MPAILRLNGLRITIYPNDHRPAHVHAIGAKGEAVLLLNCPKGPAELRESYGFSAPEIRQILADLTNHIPALCREWRYIHGSF